MVWHFDLFPNGVIALAAASLSKLLPPRWRRWNRQCAKPGEKLRLALRPQKACTHSTPHRSDNLKNNVGTVSPLRRHRSPLLGRRHSSRARGVIGSTARNIAGWRLAPNFQILDRKSTRLNSSHV